MTQGYFQATSVAKFLFERGLDSVLRENTLQCYQHPDETEKIAYYKLTDLKEILTPQTHRELECTVPHWCPQLAAVFGDTPVVPVPFN